MSRNHVETVVIGGSQAGLAVGYYLQRHGLPLVIVDEHDRVGHAWRNRWDTLRLFTPARYDGLPGMPFPSASSAYPSKDEVADYLEAYAREFALPIRTGIKVDRLSAVGDQFQVFCREEVLSAENVVVATGAFHHPRVPAFAARLQRSGAFAETDCIRTELRSHEQEPCRERENEKSPPTAYSLVGRSIGLMSGRMKCISASGTAV